MDHPIFSILSRHRFGRDTLVVAKADDGNFWLVHYTTNERVPLINFGCGDNGRVAALRAMLDRVFAENAKLAALEADTEEET